MRTLIIVFLLAGCSRSTPERTSEEPQPAPAAPGAAAAPPAATAEQAIGVGDLYSAYLADPAKAARLYGNGVRIRFVVDAIDVTPRGFTVTRDTGNGTQQRILFPKSAGRMLEGAIGKTLEARGKVVSTLHNGLLIRCD